MTSLPENPYASPALLAERVVDDEHLFNQRFRRRTTRWATFLQLTVLIVVPLALVGAGCAIGAYQETGAWMWSIATIFVTCWLCFFVVDRLIVMGYASLESQLHDRLSAEGISLQNLDATFVQFSPASRPYLYENHTNWDVGFLVFFAESIVYFGDRTRFVLPRARLEAIQAAPGFDRRHPGSAYIAWGPSPDAPRHVFALEAGSGRTAKSLKQSQVRLEAKLREWEAGKLNSQEQVALWQHLPLPCTKANGGKLFRQAVNPLAQVISVVVIASVPAWLSNVIAEEMGVLTQKVGWALVLGGAGGFVIMLLRAMVCGLATDFRQYPFETPPQTD